jgi:hypothetical protein
VKSDIEFTSIFTEVKDAVEAFTENWTIWAKKSGEG